MQSLSKRLFENPSQRTACARPPLTDPVSPNSQLYSIIGCISHISRDRDPFLAPLQSQFDGKLFLIIPRSLLTWFALLICFLSPANAILVLLPTTVLFTYYLNVSPITSVESPERIFRVFSDKTSAKTIKRCSSARKWGKFNSHARIDASWSK
jgi:hypothetical protein